MQGHRDFSTKMYALVGGWVVCIFLFGMWVGHFAVPKWLLHHLQQPQYSVLAGAVTRQTSPSGTASPKKSTPKSIPGSSTTGHSPTKRSIASFWKRKKKSFFAARPTKPTRWLARQSDLPAIAFGRLRSAAKQRRALRLLNQLLLPCGCGQSIAQCAKSNLQCPRIQNIVELVLNGVEEGSPRASIAKHIQQRVSAAHTKSPQTSPVTSLAAWSRDSLSLKGFPIRGPKQALLTIVIFANFQCSYSRQLVKQLEMLELTYGSQNMRIAYRHFPLHSHPDSWLAAEASMAAQAQGKFWPYFNLLFTNQLKLKRKHLIQYAQQLKLNISMFRMHLRTRHFRKRIYQEYSFAIEKMGLSGTPYVLINGWPVRSLEQLKQVAKKAWEQAQTLVRMGVPLEHLYTTLAQWRRKRLKRQ